MTFRDNFSSVATGYAKYRPVYPQALVDTLADRSPATDLAWDVGCGSGQLSVGLAERFDRVVATDASAQQVAQAAPHPRISYRVAPAEASGLPDGCASLVVVAQAAHWFDWPRFVAEAGRVARSGALVALVTYNDMTLDDFLAAIVGPYKDAVEPFWHPERAIVANGYADLVMPWPAVAAPPITLTATWGPDELLGYLGTWSAHQQFRAREPQVASEAWRALEDRVATLWRDRTPRQFNWPLTVKLARR